MKRRVIEDKFLEVKDEAQRRIIDAPVLAFFVGIMIGVALVWFNKLLIPLLLISVLIAVALWFFGERDDTEPVVGSDPLKTETEKQPETRMGSNY